MALCLSECNFLAEFAQVDGRDVEERGDVLQREHLHHLRTAVDEPTVAAAGGVAVVVEVTSIDHLEQVLQYPHVWSIIFGSLSNSACSSRPLMTRTTHGMSASMLTSDTLPSRQ